MADLLLTTELSLSESLPGREPLRSSLGGDKDGDDFFLSLARRSLDLLRRLRDMDRLRDRDLLRLLEGNHKGYDCEEYSQIL